MKKGLNHLAPGLNFVAAIEDIYNHFISSSMSFDIAQMVVLIVFKNWLSSPE